MANRTAKDAATIKGTNPQYLVEKIIRMRIYDAKYWKEECFAISAELLVDKGMELRYVGGVYGGNIKPTPFLCLTLKMLQIQPDKDIIIEFIRQEDSKYIRALGAFYMRLTGGSVECFRYLEPLYNDGRKLRAMNRHGQFEIVFMDDFIDQLLNEEIVCDVTLPRLQKRQVLEEIGELELRQSALDDDMDNLSDDEDEGHKEEDKSREKHRRSPERKRASSPPRKRRSRSRERRRSREREPIRKPSRRSPERSRDGRREKEGKKESSSRKREGEEEREIREANELRASLGMAPLR